MRYPTTESIAWQFETANFRVLCSLTPCAVDPEDQFDNREDIDMIREDRCLWFDATMSVWFGTEESDLTYLASDHLGCCAYRTIEEFTQAHWRDPASGRNTLAMKAQNRVICHYFPEMVTIATAAARKELARIGDVAQCMRRVA